MQKIIFVELIINGNPFIHHTPDYMVDLKLMFPKALKVIVSTIIAIRYSVWMLIRYFRTFFIPERNGHLEPVNAQNLSHKADHVAAKNRMHFARKASAAVNVHKPNGRRCRETGLH